MTAAVASSKDGLTSDQPATHDVAGQYQKILKLRDDVFAGKHPSLKLLKQVPPISKPPVPAQPLPTSTANGYTTPTTKVPAPVQNGISRTYPSQDTPSGPKPSAVQPMNHAVPGSSGLDPIFLKKSDVLVRAETQQKRQRIERALDEQLIQKRAIARQNILEEHALPDFDVTEVLRKAHEIVKPVKVMNQHATDRHVSSSDSFDENTFYSSQMDSFSEGTDRSNNKPTEAAEQQADGPQAMEIDGVNVDEPASSRSQDQSRHPVKENNTILQKPLSQEDQIARLEEELRRLKGQNKTADVRNTPPATREEEAAEEPPYSPPDVRASPSAQPGQHHISTSDIEQNQRQAIPRRSSKALVPQAREFLQRNVVAPSPVSNDMRIVRNHITSPLAPQPARVSPLATSKEPPVPHTRNNRQQNREPGTVEEVMGRRNSANQPVNSRKRRRRNSSGENTRNVVARRGAASPEIRIKEEPVSPRQYPTALGAWRPPVREEVPRPIVLDNASPRPIPAERIDQPSRRYEHQDRAYSLGQSRPLTPSGYGAGRYVEVRQDSDLRRVVSAKQLRAPVSPVAYSSGTQPYQVRAASQIYLPQSSQEPRQPRVDTQMHLSQVGQDSARRYRASAQPPPLSTYGPEHSPSPPFRQSQRSPPRQESIAMAPPPRRIVVDQYGNRFVEAPAPAVAERQVSAVPVALPNEYEPRYEQPVRASVVRPPSIDVSYGEPRYTQRPSSPTSPRCVEYPSQGPPQAPPGRARSIVYLDNDRHHERHTAHRGDNSMVHYIDYPQSARLEEVSRPREVTRMSSVRPMPSQYELPREQISRIPSVRPEQGRVISLGSGREDFPQVSRQVSARPEEVYMRQPMPLMEERPRYRYVQEPQEPQEQRYAANGSYEDGLVFEANRGVGRRIVQ